MYYKLKFITPVKLP